MEDVVRAVLNCFGTLVEDFEEAAREAPRCMGINLAATDCIEAERALRVEAKQSLRIVEKPFLARTMSLVTLVAKSLAAYAAQARAQGCFSARLLTRHIEAKFEQLRDAGDPQPLFAALDDLERHASQAVDAWLAQAQARAAKANVYGSTKRERAYDEVAEARAGNTGAREGRAGRARAMEPVSDAVRAEATRISRLLPGNEPVCFKYLVDKQKCPFRCRRVPCSGKCEKEFERALKPRSG